MAVIDKAAAAERMVVSAIVMLEHGQDPLAIHVVAASALRVLRDLIENSGDDYVEQVLKVGAFTIASARREGRSVTLPSNADIEVVIENVMAGMDAGRVNQASDLVVQLNKQERWRMLDYIVTPYNFLKHADRDPLATLDESDVDPEGAISHALTALTMVCPGKQLPVQVGPFLEKLGLCDPTSATN